jgi:DNA-binding IclR family transcriptional regulator
MSLTYRSLDVLATFTPDHPTRTLQEISRESGLPLTTTHRIVSDLVSWGALERTRAGRIQVGLRLWEVASLAPRGLGLREVALPFMEDLFVATGENVQLAVREQSEAVFIERLTGRHSVTVLTRVGDRFALHATGVGLVLLAHAPADVQEQTLARPLATWTEHTLTDPDRLRAVLAEVRRTGVAVSDRQVTLDAVSVACPIHDAGNDVVAALSVVVRHGTVSPLALTPAVRAASRGISRALGAPTPQFRQAETA